MNLINKETFDLKISLKNIEDDPKSVLFYKNFHLMPRIHISTNRRVKTKAPHNVHPFGRCLVYANLFEPWHVHCLQCVETILLAHLALQHSQNEFT